MIALILTTFLTLASALPAWATVRYADQNLAANCSGSTYSITNRTCTGTDGPGYKTAASALSATVASDTVYFRAGTWTVRWDLSGKGGVSGAPTTIAGYPGETVTYAPTYTYDGLANFLGFNSGTRPNWLIIQDLVIDGINAPTTSPKLNDVKGWYMVGVSNVIIRRNEIKRWHYSGIHLQASNNITIQNNILHDQVGTCTTGDRWYGAYLHDGDNFIVEGNDIYANPGGGLQIYSNPTNVTVRRNKIHHNNTCANGASAVGGIIVQQDLAQGGPIANVKIYNNLIYSNGVVGSGLSYGIKNNNVTGTQIYNNTIYGNRNYGIGIGDNSVGGSVNTLVKNNILYGNSPDDSVFIFSNSTGTVTATNTTANPSFTNAAAFDFTLAPGSAAINACTPISGFLYNGSVPDCGAYETFDFASASINQASLDITLGMSVNIPVSGTFTGFTVACSGSGCGTPVVASAAKLTGTDSVVRLSLTGITTGVCAAGQTWTVSYSPGGVTDGAYIGNAAAASQPLSAFTTQAVTNSCGVGPPAPPPTVTGISYLFDDATGTSAADATGGGSTGTLTGSPLPTWTTSGKHAGGITFADQVDTYVAVPYGSGVNPSTQALTVCGGVFPLAGTESSQRIAWGTNVGTNQRFYLGWFGGTWGIGIQSSGFSTNTEFPVTPGWTHACLKASSGTATLYVNGVKGLSSQSVKTYTSYALASNFRIGGEATFPINLGASTQDEWKLFTSALTDQNITDLYLNWEPPPPPPAAGVFSQVTHQFFYPNTSVAGGTPVSLAAAGASALLVRPNTSFALVTETNCTGGACAPIGERLRYSYKPVSTGVAGPFLSVPDVCGTDNICFFGPTADPLILSGTVTCCIDAGLATKVDGSTQYTMGATPVVTLAQNSSVVQRRMLTVTGTAASGDIYFFKEYDQNDVSGVGFTAGTPYTPSAGAQLTVQATSFSAPTSLRQTGSASNTLVDIIWNPVIDSTLAGYHVYESLTSGVYGSPIATITNASSALTSGSATQWRTVHTTAGTYYYVIKAFDSNGNESPASVELPVVLTGQSARTVRP